MCEKSAAHIWNSSQCFYRHNPAAVFQSMHQSTTENLWLLSLKEFAPAAVSPLWQHSSDTQPSYESHALWRQLWLWHRLTSGFLLFHFIFHFRQILLGFPTYSWRATHTTVHEELRKRSKWKAPSLLCGFLYISGKESAAHARLHISVSDSSHTYTSQHFLPLVFMSVQSLVT